MTNIDEIRKELDQFCKEKGYKLYSVSYGKEKDDYILHVEIDNHLDLNGISEVSRLISEFMDEKDYIDDAYLLDVYTVGLERVLEGYDEILNAKGQYVFVKMKKETNGIKKIEGTLTDVSEDRIEISYMQKNISKKLSVELSNIKLIRLAVKF
ncbi:MAG: ribosome maturation factor RimP [Firmicutes bacterium]|nr:ribosome maturation factor RimP [Bacillota bacterium]MDY3092102.1 ribosome maturation factor RimP [Erysipelotrichaceae bacterium]